MRLFLSPLVLPFKTVLINYSEPHYLADLIMDFIWLARSAIAILFADQIPEVPPS